MTVRLLFPALLIALVVALAPAQTTPLRDQLSAPFAAAKFSHAHWGIRVEKLDGTVVFDLNGGRNFVPASNLKLVTTAAALHRLGPDFTYETRVDLVGEVDAEGTLRGDVVIVGSGDPTLGAWHPDENRNSAWLLAGWVEKLRAAGVKRIAGDVIGDGRVYTEQYIHPEWVTWDLPYWYAAGSSGLAMEENAFRIRILPGEKVGDPARLELNPQTAYVTLLNKMKTVEAGGRSNADAVWRNEENVFIYDRTIALDKDVINERGSIWDGARYAAFLFVEALEREGIEVSGEARNIRELEDISRIDNATNRRTVATHTSAPLSEIAALTNGLSHNLFADHLLRTVAVEAGAEGSFEGGSETIRTWLKEIGVPEVDRMKMLDGSGLAAGNVIQPRQMTHLLRWMKNESPAGPAFVESLSIAGETGHLRNRLKGDATRGRIRAKTGFIGMMRGLSGYLETAGGETLVFSTFCNQYTIPLREVDAAVEEALTLLAGQREPIPGL